MTVKNPTQVENKQLTRNIPPSDWKNVPTPTNHAKLRWLQRGEHNIDLTQVWVDGYFIGGVSQAGKARLHPPTETILIENSGAIITVLNSANIPYTADHLLNCDSCELEYKPETGEQGCPWCREEKRGVKR